MSVEERLSSLLLAWQEQHDQGRHVSAAELCRDCPELAADLDERIRVLERMNALLRPEEGGADRDGATESCAGLTATRETVGVDGGANADAGVPGGGVPGYDLLEELGRGANGVVYKARQRSLNRLVALKMVLGGAHADAEALARFYREAETVARLKHAGIVQVYEFGSHQSNPFLALELLEGGALAQRLKGEPQPPAEAAQLVETLARAVQAAHEVGVVHRDLKPANVLLAVDGTPRIADFGLAKDSGSAMTATGALMGTPSYMAPEQAGRNNKEVGPPADIYALGAILYELLTGRPPFKGASAWDTVQMVIETEPVAPSRLQLKVPRDLETICLKCLRKQPAQRYASALELAEDLQRFAAGEPIQARPVGRLERGVKWVRRRPALAALYGVSILGAAALLGMAFAFTASIATERGKALSAESEASAARELAETREFFALLSQVRERRVDPQPGWTWLNLDDLGKAARLKPAAERGPELRSEAAAALGELDVRLAKVLGESFMTQCVAFDPTGRYLALGQMRAQGFVNCAVQLVDLTGKKQPTFLTFAPANVLKAMLKGTQEGVRCLEFSPDGRWLVAGTIYGSLRIWDLAIDSRPLLTRQAHSDAIRWLVFNNDGGVLFSAGDDRQVKRWETPGWQETAVHKVGGDIDGLAVHPREGWVLCSTESEDKTWLLSEDTLAPLSAATDKHAPSVRFSMCGQWGLQAGITRLLDVTDPRNRRLHRSIGPPPHVANNAGVREVVISPNGASFLSSSSYKIVRLWDAADGRLVADLPVKAGSAHAAFSSDGHSIAIAAGPQTLLFEVSEPAQEAHAVQPRDVHAFSLSPDGNHLAISRYGYDSCAQIWPALRRGGLTALATRPQESSSPSLCFGPEGWLVLKEDGALVVWDGLGPATRWHDTADAPIIRQIRCTPDRRVWTAEGPDIVARSVPEGKVVARWSSATLRYLTGSAYPTALATGKHWVVGGGNNGHVYILRSGAAEQVAANQVADTPISSIALDADETRAAAGTERGELYWLSVPAGQTVARVSAHRDEVTALACSAQLLVSGGRDRTVKFWRRHHDRLEELFTLKLSTPVRGLAFHPDGARLFVLQERNAAVRIWHLDRLWQRFHDLGVGLEASLLTPTAPAPTAPAPAQPPPVVIAPTSAHGLNGLKAELYSDTELRRLFKVRHDANLDFSWGNAACDPELPADRFSIRWSAWLKAARAGLYTLRLEADDGAQLWLDGKRLIDCFPFGSKHNEVQVRLTDQPHEIRVEFYEAFDDAVCRLHWAQDGGFAMQPIPTEALFHTRPAPDAK